MSQTETADEAQQQPPHFYAEDFPEAVVDGVAQFFGKPRLRGWIHVYAAVELDGALNTSNGAPRAGRKQGI